MRSEDVVLELEQYQQEIKELQKQVEELRDSL